ncbi:hypothetical protein [Spirosoma sp. KUDC1026]|uniref:hypothetical protein n=1 Tax=Spirosoma sp. KUDC1026 TaxID=2745947 RepID=UPI00159BDCE9|nr:hypothetical protein [Spirosoma sp. KUDC1026]QKZ15035.1 hypothetical protein HU175_21385 [Spirosoma sp. KUDC1026]
MSYQALGNLVGLILLGFVLATCSDHQLQPPTSPLRFRLKATNDSVSGSRVEYNYDVHNRFVSFTREDGSVGSVLYDDQNRYKQFEYRPGPSTSTPLRNSYAQRVDFLFKPNSKDFTTVTYFFPNGVESFAYYRHYFFDATNQLTLIQRAALDGFVGGYFSYEYTGDNITTEAPGPPSRINYPYFYTYDDKPNPYYGLITPYSLATSSGGQLEGYRWAVQQYSRNNVTETKYVTQIFPSRYKYNSQGLPVQQTDFSDGGRKITAQITFTYETF